MSKVVGRGLAAVGAAALMMGLGALPAQADGVDWYFSPETVQAGGKVEVGMSAINGCSPSPVTSPGLVAPIKWGNTPGHFPRLIGYGTAVKQPGRYVATLTCKDGQKTSKTFMVAGTPDPTPTPTKPKPTAKPKPKPQPQVVVKPKGAPQTGGGYSAA
ncbi:hypothetical protein AB5J62_12735 [Amycolatopsis sp. cg5]|uniref:hypothetical protein n=1 Tax=Amycolatopsis sp. cg5 TaxID=3238802 RepID=UPI00352613C7